MNTNAIKDEVKSTTDNVTDKVKNAVVSGDSKVAKSGKDWLHYIQTHPLQSVFFSIIGYFALKGMFK
jgi:hypothetical protein